MPNRLKNIQVKFISLVENPANGMPLILKDAGSRVFKLAKFDEERQVAYGIVYAPNEVDSQGDFADQFEIEKAAYDFMKSKRTDKVDQNHDFKPIDGTFIAESWLIKEYDPWFGDMEGAWAVGIKVEDPAVWNTLKQGNISGLSMAGKAEREPVTKADSTDSALLKSLFDRLTSIETGLANVHKQDLTPVTEKLTQITGVMEQLGKRITAVEKQRLSVVNAGSPAKPDNMVNPIREIL